MSSWFLTNIELLRTLDWTLKQLQMLIRHIQAVQNSAQIDLISLILPKLFCCHELKRQYTVGSKIKKWTSNAYNNSIQIMESASPRRLFGDSIGRLSCSISRPHTARSNFSTTNFVEELDRLHEQQVYYGKRVAFEKKRREKLEIDIKV